MSVHPMVDFETRTTVVAFFKMSSWRLTENKTLFLVLEEFLESSHHPLPSLIPTFLISPIPSSYHSINLIPLSFISPILHPLIPPPSNTILFLDLIPSSRVRFWSVQLGSRALLMLYPGLILTSTFLQLCTSPTNNRFCCGSC